jgi:hypothetical protein
MGMAEEALTVTDNVAARLDPCVQQCQAGIVGEIGETHVDWQCYTTSSSEAESQRLDETCSR